LETPLQSQILDRAEPVVAAIAAAGLRRWRVEPIDIEALIALSLVQNELVAIGVGSEVDADARRDAVDAAIREAIKQLPEPYYAAALAHFGADDEGEKTLGKGGREEAAAAVLGRSGKWYFNAGRSAKYLDKTPSEYVIALVTCALGGIADPVSHLARGAASEPAAESSPGAQDDPASVRRRRLHPPSSRRSTRLVASGLLAAVLFVVIAGLVAGWWSGGSPPKRQPTTGKDSHQAAPVLRVNTDASCASLSANVPERRSPTEFVDSPGQLQGGEGGLKGKVTPGGTYGNLVDVTKGQTVELSITLHDTEYGSVSDVVVQVKAKQEQPSCTRLVALTRSTTSPRDRADQGPVILRSPSGHPPRFKYVPGSAYLLTESGRQVAKLSDGVMGKGTAIPYQIGPSPPDYFVNFDIRIE
jgi:hypothetical protein